MKSFSREKKMVGGVFVFLFVMYLSTAVLMEQNVIVSKYGKGSFESGQAVQYIERGSVSSDEKRINAVVKGSIYETGSNVTVFGACYDGDSYLIPDADAYFTAWYPNGTIVVGPNATMVPILDDFQGSFPNGTGRWLISLTMMDTIGTYLTEMRCEYQGQWAVALGEWQNPEWVKKIGDTYVSVGNISTMLSNVSSQIENMSVSLQEFRNETNTNFTTVLTEINNIQTAVLSGAATPEMVDELSRLIHSIDMNIWVLDETNPFYSLASGVNNFYAVDMLGTYDVQAVGDGIAAYWDGYSWTYRNMSGTKLYGVSILPANMPYAWYVGTNVSNSVPIISVNGDTPYIPSLPGDTSTGLSDVKIFQQPNNPSGAFYGYVLANDGRVYFSNNSGVSWSYIGSVGAGSGGRLSEVVANHAPGLVSAGYVLMVGQGDEVMTVDENNVTVYNVTGEVKGISVLYYNVGYVVTHGVDDLPHVYVWNGTGMTEDYVIEDVGIEPVGIAAVATNDVWLITRDPSTFYHFDGTKWDYANVPFSAAVSVVINFGGNVSNTTGVWDVSMLNGKAGYIVGDDGLVLVFKNHYDARLDELLLNISQQIDALELNISVDLSSILAGLSQINSSILDINASLQSSLDTIETKIDQMNASIEYKLDNVISNVTYTQLYLETTMFPMMNATYQNTLLILASLGIIEGKINQTIELQNTTISIVNQTQQDVAELLNSSRRIRAWVTQ